MFLLEHYKSRVLVSFLLLLAIFLASCGGKDDEKIEVPSLHDTQLILNVYEDSKSMNISNNSSFNLKKDLEEVVFEVENPQREKPVGVYINGKLLDSITAFSKRSFHFSYDEIRRVTTSNEENKLQIVQCNTEKDFEDLTPNKVTDVFTTSFSFEY